MNIIIFAGGAGTRLWPLSRKNSPKQFAVLKDNVSTLQMAVSRVAPFGLENVYIATHEQYASLVKEQVPAISANHIYTEPSRRDLAAAVALTLLRMKKQGISGTAAVIWSDHFMDHPDRFREALLQAGAIVDRDSSKIVFLGERARFPNHNLGWIHLGKHLKESTYAFAGWKYRPDLDVCEKMYASGEWMWNPGYFVFNIDTMLGWYGKFQPEMLAALEAMTENENILVRDYKRLEAMSFDNAIIEHLSLDAGLVLKVDLGWSDPGTLYALKEALTGNKEDNHERGHVVSHGSRDCFIHNEEQGKLVATVGLEGVVVVNTKDALLVCHKNAVPDIKALLKKLEDHGKEQYL